VAFDRTGRILISGDNGGVVKLWDLAAGKNTTILDGAGIAVYSVKFSPDGAILAAAMSDGSLVLWDMAPTNEGKQQRVELSKEEFDARWSELSDINARKAYRAMCGLIRSPQQTVGFLEQHLPPVAWIDRQRLAQLIADLDSDRFAVRGNARKALEAMGDLAEKALRQTLAERPSLEMRRQIEALLEKRRGPITQPETLRALRAVAVLEDIGTPEARSASEVDPWCAGNAAYGRSEGFPAALGQVISTTGACSSSQAPSTIVRKLPWNILHSAVAYVRAAHAAQRSKRFVWPRLLRCAACAARRGALIIMSGCDTRSLMERCCDWKTDQQQVLFGQAYSFRSRRQGMPHWLTSWTAKGNLSCHAFHPAKASESCLAWGLSSCGVTGTTDAAPDGVTVARQ
jgi:hypothetical protein